MMKKLFTTVALVFCMLCSVCVGGMPVSVQTKAQSVALVSQNVEEKINVQTIEAYLQELSTTYVNRIAGSKEEENAADYIFNQMQGFQTSEMAQAYTPVERNGEVGKISFMYENSAGNVIRSHNVWFRKESKTANAKTLIFTCNIDSLSSLYEIEEGKVFEGVHASGAAISVLLSLADALKDVELPYHVEFVFFGAGCDGNQGSAQMLRGMTDEEVAQYFMNINIDKIAYGADVFAYTFDQDNSYSLQAKQALNKAANMNFAELNATWAVTNTGSVAGLPYTHVGLESDNVNFLQRGVLSLHIFRGNYTKEHFGNNLQASYLDSLEYLEQESKGLLYNGISNIANSVYAMVTEPAFYTTFENAVAPSLKAYTNYNYALYAFVAMLALCVLGATLYYSFVLMPRAKRAVTSRQELETLIQNMTQNIMKNVGGDDSNTEVMRVMKEQIKDASTTELRANVKETEESKKQGGEESTNVDVEKAQTENETAQPQNTQDSNKEEQSKDEK